MCALEALSTCEEVLNVKSSPINFSPEPMKRKNNWLSNNYTHFEIFNTVPRPWLNMVTMHMHMQIAIPKMFPEPDTERTKVVLVLEKSLMRRVSEESKFRKSYSYKPITNPYIVHEKC